MEIIGKLNGPLSRIGNYTAATCATGMAALFGVEFKQDTAAADDAESHCAARPIGVCAGCPHRGVYMGLIDAVKKLGYKKDEPVITDFSFEARPGQRIAIVGPTGAGKTTIVKLLMRFYELDGGSISVDGQDITKLSRSNLRELFGMVLQETWLNSSTVKENIRYGRTDATDEEVKEAAKAAHAHRFIRSFPRGYRMKINEEATNISAGQKQLLTIARAFLADAPILIFDEATSSVDTRTEKQIQSAMAKLMADRTSFIIAHRLSTIKDADYILVMNEGNIIEQGRHEELLAKGGFYAELYNSQFAE